MALHRASTKAEVREEKWKLRLLLLESNNFADATLHNNDEDANTDDDDEDWEDDGEEVCNFRYFYLLISLFFSLMNVSRNSTLTHNPSEPDTL